MKKKPSKVAVYSGTQNLYPYMVTAAKSLLLNSDVDKIYFLIEDDIFPYKLPDEIECINVSGQTYFSPDGANMHSHFTYMSMMRATYSKLFPDLDRILSLDVDTIVDQDISDIWDLPIEDCYFAASSEPSRCSDGKMYYNIGVCLFNLEKMRDGMTDRIIEELNTHEHYWIEQDVLSDFCNGHVYDMPGMYNGTLFTVFKGDPKIIHYAAIKRWWEQPEVGEYAKYTFDEIGKYRMSKNFAKSKKTRLSMTYMIHTCNKRLWYVEKYLIPSMEEQGILRENIIVWKDTKKLGNLESFVKSMKWIANNQTYLGGIWHLQDDVVISRRFKELTEKYNTGFAAGFSNKINDGGNLNMIGVVQFNWAWFSFPCIRIPNRYAKEFVDWYENDVVPNKLFEDWRNDGKNDDAIFKQFMLRNHPEEVCQNFIPNIVDHIDYLIGGSIINQQREGTRRAYWFEEPKVVEDLEKALKK